MAVTSTETLSTSFNSCLERQAELVQEFSALAHRDAQYNRLMTMGRSLLLSQDLSLRTPQYLVQGCQSEVYLRARLENGHVYFSIYSEALISRGLAALLLAIYDGQPPETIIKCPPNFLSEIGIFASLSPGRSNGLANMHLRMQQEAIRCIINL